MNNCEQHDAPAGTGPGTGQQTSSFRECSLQGAPFSNRKKRRDAQTLRFRERLFAKLDRYNQQVQKAATEKEKAAFVISINRVLRKIAEVSKSHLFDGPGGKPTPAGRSKSSQKVGPGVRAR